MYLLRKSHFLYTIYIVTNLCTPTFMSFDLVMFICSEHIFSINNCCILPCIQYIYQNKNIKVTSTERDSNNISYFEQRYSSYTIESCIPCNSVTYERKLHIRSSNVKTIFGHHLTSWYAKETCSNILVHLCIVYSSRISQNIFGQIYFTNYLT